MNFMCQQSAIADLRQLAKRQQHGVIICGISGCGKTYLARQYADMLEISEFNLINPVVADLKSTIADCIENAMPIVLCIENLDTGVTQAAYPLLKIIEDCPSYMYIVVTCNNLAAIPDTIPSRCALVSVNPPTRSDLEQYALYTDANAYERLKDNKVWGCTKGFKDITALFQLTQDQVRYFNTLADIITPKDSVSNISWKLTHFADNTDTPIFFIIRYLLYLYTGHKRQACINCLNDLAENRMSKNAIISKLVFELNYT